MKRLAIHPIADIVAEIKGYAWTNIHALETDIRHWEELLLMTCNKNLAQALFDTLQDEDEGECAS